jgi:Ring finger domain
MLRDFRAEQQAGSNAGSAAGQGPGQSSMRSGSRQLSVAGTGSGGTASGSTVIGGSSYGRSTAGSAAPGLARLSNVGTVFPGDSISQVNNGEVAALPIPGRSGTSGSRAGSTNQSRTLSTSGLTATLLSRSRASSSMSHSAAGGSIPSGSISSQNHPMRSSSHHSIAMGSAAPSHNSYMSQSRQTSGAMGSVGPAQSRHSSARGIPHASSSSHHGPPISSIPASSAVSSASSPRCTICQERLHTGDEVLTLQCTHQFHPRCLGPWVASTPTCPICRGPYEPNRRERFRRP